MQNSKMQLLEGPPGEITLHTHLRESVRRTVSIYMSATDNRHKDFHTGRDESCIHFPVGWH